MMAEVDPINTQGIVFPDADLPTYYVDGIANYMPSAEVGKMYLVRVDPALSGEPVSTVQPVAQLVMTNAAFLRSFVFLERVVESLVRDGYVSRQQLDEMRARQGGARDIASL